jgi:hypothetical protein
VNARETPWPVVAGSVYVWRAFRAPSLSYDGFASFLGSVFLPACVQLQPPIGLRAFLPTMVPQASKPPAVPDQTALMFWRTPAAHDEAKVSLAERIYSNLHGGAFDMARSSLPEVPSALDPATTALKSEQPYYLIDRPADWMLGSVHHFVGARRPDLGAPEFLTQAASAAKALQQNVPAGVDAALVCCGNDYLVAWSHGAKDSLNVERSLKGFASLTQPVLSTDAHPLDVTAQLWDDWPGFNLTVAPTLNLRFARPDDAKPRTRANV